MYLTSHFKHLYLNILIELTFLLKYLGVINETLLQNILLKNNLS